MISVRGGGLLVMLLKSESHSCGGCEGYDGNKGGWLVADFVGDRHTTY